MTETLCLSVCVALSLSLLTLNPHLQTSKQRARGGKAEGKEREGYLARVDALLESLVVI